MKSNKKWLAVGRKVLAWLLVASMAAGNLPASVARAAELPTTELTDVSASDVSVVASDDVVVDDVESTVSSNDAVADDLAADVSDGDLAAELMSTETEEDISAKLLAAERAGEDASLVPVIKVDTDRLSTLVEQQSGVVYNYITDKAEANYQKTNPVYGDVLAAKIKNAVTVELGATTSDYLKSKLTYAWKKADGAAVSEPDAVGEYKLVASLAAQENYCVAAADVEVLALEVKKAEIKLHVDNSFRPGDTAQYVIDQNAGYTVYVVDVDGNEVEVARDEYATVTFEVYKAYPTGTAEGGYTYTKLAATDVLQGKEDYRLEAIVTLKDAANYEVKEDKFNIKLGDQIPTWIEIDGAAKGKTYDGEPLVGYTPVDFTTAGEKGFTAKVFYRDEKTGEKKEVPGKEAGTLAEIKGTWYIDSKVIGEADHLVKIGDESFVPVDAGVYYYVLTYADENGTYANASSAEDKNNKDGLSVRVEIKPAQIVVVPEITVDADNPVYDGTSVSSVLRRVEYKVYAVNNGVRSTDPMSVDEYFWGSAYSTDDREQYYAPVFQIERGLKDAQGNVATWANYTGKIVLEETVTEKDANGNDQEKKLQYGYRVVFSGYKTIFNESGNRAETVDINFSQKNYTVDTTLVTKENDAKVFIPTPSTEVVINVAPILALHENKGATLESAFVKEYDGENLYQNRGEYKIATVTPSEAADSLSLVYRWEVANIYESLIVDDDETEDDILKVDKDGKLIYELLEWTERDGNGSYNNNVENYAVPYEPGIYRLKVSLGTSGKYHAEDAYVYYVIQPQNTLVELTGTLSVYADGITTAGDLLNSLQTKNPEQTDTYVQLKVYPVTVSDAGVATKVGAEGEAAEGEAAEAVSTPIEKLIKYYFEEERDTYFRVEKEAANVGWVKCVDNEILENGVKYRVIFNSEAYNADDRIKVDTYIDADKKETEYILYDNRSYYNDDYGYGWFNTYPRSRSYRAAVGDTYKNVYVSDFYNFGQKIDAINHIVNFKFYENVAVAVEAKQSAATEVEISVDETKLTGNVKTYDGKPFDLTNLQNLIKVTKTADGSDVSETVKPMLKIQFWHSEQFWAEFADDNAYEIWYDLMGKSVDAAKAIHADDYIVTISLAANADYKQANLVLDTKYVIERKKVNVKVTPKEEVRAGKQVPYSADQFVADYILASDNILNCCTFEIDGEPVSVVPAEEGATGIDETEVSKIVGKPYNWRVCRSIDEETDRYEGYLKSSETYYAVARSFEYGLREDANYLNGLIDYRVDYEAVCEKVVFTPKRAAASVDKVNVPLKDDVTHDATLDQFTHTITARASVPFVDGNTVSGDQGAKKGEGNFFQFRLWVPGEFRGDKRFAEDTVEGSYRDSIFFKNSIENIEKSGGVVIRTANNYIEVQYDAAKGGQPTFDVLWAKDYVETYVVDLAGMTLDVDLRKAVEPKSLAFSGAAKTMYVGETQQLDVKLKKNQMSDIILLGYSSDNENVLRVSEDGFVTALTTGSATIEVFPCVMVNGEKTRIQAEGNKKVKSAKVKITVKNVSKTKVTKIKAGDTYAEVTYNAPADGYRREAYVLAGKAKEVDFEQKIAAVKNGDYSAFVAVDLNISGTEKAAGNKGAKTGAFTITGLKAGKAEYTVYVRNVSGLRELEDNGQVAVSFAGSVKTFKTTAPEIAGLNILFDSTITVETTRDYGTQYVAQFANKSTKLGVQAKLWQRYLENYADGGDYVWRYLPLGASEKKIFMVPKLQYFVSDKAYDYADDIYDEDEGEYVQRYYNPDKGRYTEWSNLSAKVREIINNGVCELYGNMVYYNGYWYDKTSAVAKVDKSGKITFTGVTSLSQPIYVLVTDTVSKEADVEELIIKASPDNLTAKSVKLQPGQGIWLRDYLDYKQKNAKVVNYGKYFRDLSISAESNDQFKINYVADAHNNHTVQGGDYWIQAIAPGSLEINVTDNTVGKSAKMKITCAALESVKNLKVQAAYDDKFRITFSYPRNDVQFKYEFKTASGKVIKTEITNSYGEWDAKAKKYVYTVNFGDPDEIDNWVDWLYRSYDARDLGLRNTTIDTTMANRRNRINMLSNYTVTVTALDGDQMSKPVNLKVKTTNIPASYHDIVAENLVWYDKDSRGSANYDGGEDISISESGYDLSDSFVFKSGNTYTLTMSGYSRYNSVAQRRMSDTLVWKSYDNKVASVKTNAGTYSAKLTAVRPGTTVIEVSSKLTKKVIARHTIVVGAVGDAHVYYADNEPYNGYDMEFLDSCPVTERDVLAITLNKAISVTLQPGERQWFVFTAPAYGYYKVSLSNKYESMGKGAKRYFSVTNTGTEASTYQVYVIEENNDVYTREVVLGDNLVGSGQSYYFIVPEDNTYTIEFVDKADPNKKSPNKIVHAYKKGTIWTLGNLSQPTLGKEFIMRISKRELEGALSLTTDTNVALNNKDEVKWYSFTAEESNSYTFTITPAEAAIGAKQLKIGYYTNLTEAENGDILDSLAAEVKPERKIKKGETVYIGISSADAAADSIVNSVIKVSKRDAGEAISVGTKEGITFAENGEKWFEFTAPSAGIYQFTATGTKKAKTEGATDVDATLLMQSYTELDDDTARDGSFNRTSYMKAGDKIYVRLSENSGNNDPDTTVTAKIVIEKVSIDFTGSLEIKVPANGSKRITWNPKNAGRYNIAMSTTAEKSLADNLSGSVDGENFTTTDPVKGRYLTAGNKSIWIYNDNAVEVTVTVTVSEFAVDKVEIGKDHAISLAANGEQWFKFIPEESNSYVFSFAPNAASKEANYTVDLEFYQGIDSNDSSFAFELGADRERTFAGGATYFIKITPHQTLADNVAVGGNLKITKREFTGVLPMSGISVTLGSSIERRYEFTAPEHGFYTFSAEGSKVLAAGADPVAANVRLARYSNLTSNSALNPTISSNKVSLPTVELDAGDHYILAVSSNEATATQAVTAKISVKKETMFSIGSINITVPKKAEDGTVGSALVYWFPRSTWRYNITMSTSAENADTVLDARVYLSSLTVAAPLTGYYGEERTGYPVSLTNSSDADITVTINVSLQKTERLTTAEAGNTVKANRNIPGWYEFTAPKTADYVFKMTLAANDQSLSTNIYRNFNDYVGNISGAGERTISLEEDETIYLRVSTSYSTTDAEGKLLTPDVTGNIKISEFVYTDILQAGDTGTNVDFTKANTDARRCVFVAEEDGLYTFTWAAREAGKPFNVSVSGDINRYGQVKYLVKGQRVKFSMSPNGTPEENAPYEGNIKVTKRDSVAGNLQVGSTAPVTLANDSYVWYAFTATKDNMYEISFEPKEGGSAAEIDTVEYYSEEKSANYSTWSDNFTRTLALDKDKKIYFRLRASEATADNKAEYVFKVTERTETGILEDAKESSIIATRISSDVDGNWYKFVPTLGVHEYTIDITSDSENTTIYMERYSSLQKEYGEGSYSSSWGMETMWLYGEDSDDDGVVDNAYYFRASSYNATDDTSVTGKVTIQLVPEIN